ncbi:hypothetical protein CpB0461 [Chlamydia pneumoniae TW-183]|uniref:Uncharacterized protein n=2 Tax=Chlamydia pneumoniae TaxID=83558 RepID=A0A0F7WG29_CHLPN|nr:hypothetical protein [Chlamydia pneumoniae]AAP98392.1 hypothetical protein CpB0461 [Chlamydia pneumoniae TW-183]CRI32948.1 Uncharacterized protein BN1224_Wien1_A_04550 [Chlamydia pneumoniae]CRI35811.1 Uncharacterized protein BN1224_CM1_A_04580 [Chlamydia pneumoniae]CRI36939.1 Uncharacterized protein BN1224_CV14_A_04580 [Chlamydia pneumoniae]CRI38062.1 Uncharacterized protein BN1224_CV15_B_03850 [Chlamydia pneumoniae]
MIDAENQNPKDGGSFTSLHTDPKNLFDEEGMPSPSDTLQCDLNNVFIFIKSMFF